MKITKSMNNNYNIVNKNKNQINFKGYTIGPDEIWTSTGYSTSGPGGYVSGYKVPKNATPNYPGAYPNKYTKIYKAAPFEIIPEEIYKTHDYTIRDDLRLSQIQKDYKNGYNNFASNAVNEQKFLEYHTNKYKKQSEEHKRLIDGYKKRMEFTTNDSVKQKYAIRLQKREKGFTESNKQMEGYKVPLQNAKERFKVLKALDDKIGEIHKSYSEEQYEQKKLMDYRNPFTEETQIKEKLKKIKELEYEQSQAVKNAGNDLKPFQFEQIEEEKAAVRARYDVKINRLKEGIKNLNQQIADGKAEIPNIIKKCGIIRERISQLYKELDNCMANVEKLYKAKYPNWL